MHVKVNGACTALLAIDPPAALEQQDPAEGGRLLEGEASHCVARPSHMEANPYMPGARPQWPAIGAAHAQRSGDRALVAPPRRRTPIARAARPPSFAFSVKLPFCRATNVIGTMSVHRKALRAHSG